MSDHSKGARFQDFVKKGGGHLYPGWWMVVVTSIISGLGAGFVSQGISLIFKPLATELSLSRAATSLATGITKLGAIEAPLSGWLADKYNPKWIITIGIGFMIAGLALMNFADSAWKYYVFWGVLIGIGQNLALTIAVEKSLSDWFVARRGLAFGIKFAIMGICQIALVPVVTWLVLIEGWRTTCLIWAGVMTLSIPLILIFVKSKRPEYYGLLPDGYKSELSSEDKDGFIEVGMQYAQGFQEHEFTMGQALKTPAFWLTLIAWSCPIIVMSGFTVHIVPFLTDMSISETSAGGMLSMMIFFTIPSRLFGGFLADRFPKNRMQYISAMSVFIQALGFIVFLMYPSIVLAYILLILFGLGNGVVTPLRLSMSARFFGRKAFASIIGMGLFFNAPLSFLSPIFTGWVYDTTGNYSTAFITFAGFLLLSTAIFLFVKPPVDPLGSLSTNAAVVIK